MCSVLDLKGTKQLKSKRKIKNGITIKDILLHFVVNNTQSNKGRTMITQKTKQKQITWKHKIVILRQY